MCRDSEKDGKVNGNYIVHLYDRITATYGLVVFLHLVILHFHSRL